MPDQKSNQNININTLLSQLAKKSKEKSDEMNAEDMTPDKEDLNILPLPDTQKIRSMNYGSWIEWGWIIGDIKVYGFLCTSDIKLPDSDKELEKGDYEVQVFLGEQSSTFYFSSITAKAVGQALVSAANWVNIWKEHAGYFLEKELMGENVEEKKNETKEIEW